MALPRIILSSPLPEPLPPEWLPPELASADEVILHTPHLDLPMDQLLTQVEQIQGQVSIPITWAHPLRQAADVAPLLEAGVDRVLLPPDLVLEPPLLQDISRLAPPYRLALAVIGRFSGGRWLTFVEGGRSPTPLELFRWMEQARSMGVGEFHLTLLGLNGEVTLDEELLKRVAHTIPTPVLLTCHTPGLDEIQKVIAAGVAGLILEVGPDTPPGSLPSLRDQLGLPPGRVA